MNKKKTIILTSIIIGVLVVTLGLTYAVLSFNETGGNSQLVLGDIWMKYSENNVLRFIDAMPSSTYDSKNYFEFTISGKNTYTKKDIWYAIHLTNGEQPEDKTIRIRDDLLRFRLTEVINDVEEELVNNASYNDLTNKRIWVDTIASIDGDFGKTYRLYMWISDTTIIGGGDADYDYSMEDWEQVFASIKVNVVGDFVEKTITDESCFETALVYNDEVYTYDPKVYEYELNLDATEEQIQNCVNYLDNTLTNYYSPESYSLCTGGTSYAPYAGNLNLGEYIRLDHRERGNYKETYDNLVNIGIIISYVAGGYRTSSGTELDPTVDPVTLPLAITDYDSSSCDPYVVIPEKINNNNVTTIGEQAFFESSISGVVIPDTVTKIERYAFSYNNLIDIDIPSSVTSIGSGAFVGNLLPDSKAFIYNRTDNDGNGIPEITTVLNSYGGANKNVVIPNTVTTITSDSLLYNIQSLFIPRSVVVIENEACYNCDLTTITFEENSNLTTIGEDAFGYNNLTNLEIPASVMTIGDSAFSGNGITTLTFEENSQLMTIGADAFNGNKLTNLVIPNSVITIKDSAFMANPITNLTFEENSRLTTIEDSAFSGHALTNVTIPDNVVSIGSSVFNSNTLETITLGSGIQYINEGAFYKNNLYSQNLKSITFTSKTCEEIKNIQASSTDTTKYFPWLQNGYPYYMGGYEASIYGTDGECTY